MPRTARSARGKRSRSFDPWILTLEPGRALPGNDRPRLTSEKKSAHRNRGEMHAFHK